MNTYQKNDAVWREIQRFLPAENRLPPGEEPDEYGLPLDRFHVHVDHYHADKPRARVIIFHGVGGNGRLLSFIAHPLHRHGFDVICPDLPLYGYTEFDGSVIYDDWIQCGAKIARHYSDVPVFLFGLSAGGMLAYQVCQEIRDVKGIIATCLLDQRIPEVKRQSARVPWLAAVAEPFLVALNAVAGSIKLPMKAIANMRAIANNEELALLLMRDKRSSGARVPISFVLTMLRAKIKTDPQSFTACPVLLVHPGDDRWTDVSLSRLFFDKLACDKQLQMLDGGGHFPVEAKALAQLETHCCSFISSCC